MPGRNLRASTPMSMTAAELGELRGLSDPIELSEVEEIYLPLSRLLRLYYEASAALRVTVGGFLSEQIRPALFIIAVAGSVAVGKSTTARVLRALISQWPQHPGTALVTTDNFLYPNADLAMRSLTDRKGFPESYDRRALLRFVQQVRGLRGPRDRTGLLTPRLRHRARRAAVSAAARHPHSRGPQRAAAGPGRGAGCRRLHRLLHLRRRAHGRHQRWFLARLRALRDTAFTDPRSPFRQLAEVSLAEVDAFGAEVWKTINEVNLVENIQPTRARATLVLHKDAGHAVTRVGLRRF